MANNVELFVVRLLATVHLLYPFLLTNLCFLLSCVGPLHIMETGPLSNRWFATVPCVFEKNTYSAVVGYCSIDGCVGLVAYSVVKISYCFC